MPAPYTFSRMEAFYDWSIRSLRETYHDICVPIFPGGAEWSCDFLNTNGAAYLLQHDDRAPGQPECCVFERPWSPPAPDFLSHAGLPYLKNTTYDGTTVMWWQTTDVPPSSGGPFGYGYSVQDDGSLAPYAFYFGGFWRRANGTLEQASTMQYYEDFRAEKPPPSTWELPAACAAAPNCTNWPTQGARRPGPMPKAAAERAQCQVGTTCVDDADCKGGADCLCAAGFCFGRVETQPRAGPRAFA